VVVRAALPEDRSSRRPTGAIDHSGRLDPNLALARFIPYHPMVEQALYVNVNLV